MKTIFKLIIYGDGLWSIWNEPLLYHLWKRTINIFLLTQWNATVARPFSNVRHCRFAHGADTSPATSDSESEPSTICYTNPQNNGNRSSHGRMPLLFSVDAVELCAVFGFCSVLMRCPPWVFLLMCLSQCACVEYLRSDDVLDKHADGSTWIMNECHAIFAGFEISYGRHFGSNRL